jgi:hypothetical protein
MSHGRRNRWVRAALGALAITGCGRAAPTGGVLQAGKSYDSATSNAVAAGVVHRRLIDNAGPFAIHVLEVDLRRRDLAVRSVRAMDSLRGRELTSVMAARRRPSGGETIAAVNADFFSLRTGENENNQVVDGEVFKAVPTTDSPFDSLHTVHSQFGVTCEGKPVIDRFVFDGIVITPPPAVALLPLDAVNFRPRGDALVLYTSRYGTTPADSIARGSAELALRMTGRRGDTVVYRAERAPGTGGGSTIADGHAVLAGSGVAAEVVRRIAAVGSQLRIVARFKPNRGRLCTLVGGWPRIVTDGQSVAEQADQVEGTFPRFSATRHPRAGVGFSRDSATLYLVTVDGRQESSSGMSLVEFAALMRNVGAYQGLNLDGGGSATMVIRGRIVNQPSDSTGERTVGNAIIITRR